MRNRFKGTIEDFDIVGIYFLRHKGEVVYVGEATCIFSRLAQHHKEKKKIFDEYSFFETDCSDKQRKCKEARIIRQHKPKYNVVHNTPSKRKSKSVYLVLSN